MSRTERTSYDGQTIRDGDWGKKCPEPGCPVCVQGREQKRIQARRARKDERDE